MKPEYLSENPSENLSENYNNQNYPLNNENNFESLIFELESGLEFYNTYKNYVDLELLYSTIITSGICIIPYFLFSSFQNLRNIFFIFQFIIFIILTFNNKYKNHYLWKNTKLEPIQELPYPIITDINMKHLSKDLNDLNITTIYQNFSIIKTEEYSKECLLNYFIKEDEICPITDIIISYNIYKEFIDYSALESEKFNIYFKKNYKYGKLYQSFYNNSISIDFQSILNYKDISIIKKLENNKLLNPFSKLKNFCYYSDYIWLFLFPISLMYYFMESRDDKKWNYFRSIDIILQLILFIIYILRYALFVDIKNFFKNNLEEFNNIDLNNFIIDKYKSSYYPNFNINAESFPVAIGISMIFYCVIFLITRNKKSRQNNNFGNEKYYFFNDVQMKYPKENIVYIIYYFL